MRRGWIFAIFWDSNTLYNKWHFQDPLIPKSCIFETPIQKMAFWKHPHIKKIHFWDSHTIRWPHIKENIIFTPHRPPHTRKMTFISPSPFLYNMPKRKVPSLPPFLKYVSQEWTVADYLASLRDHSINRNKPG